MANIEDFLNADFRDQEYELSWSKLFADYAFETAKMSVYLEQVLFKQIELKALIKDREATELEIDEKVQEAFDKIQKLVGEKFHNKIALLTK